MMRYQGLRPDNLPLSNGRRSHWRTSKEEDGIISRDIDDDGKTVPSFVESKGLPRFRSPSTKSQDQNFSSHSGGNCNGNGGGTNSPPQLKNGHNHDTTGDQTRNPSQEFNNSPIRCGGGNGGDGLLQWGHRKRSRCSRTTAAATVNVTTYESSLLLKLQRKPIAQPRPTPGLVELVDKHKMQFSRNTNTNIMAPPPSTLPSIVSTPAEAAANTTNSNGKGGNLKSCSENASDFLSHRRNLEERSGGGSGSQPPRSGGGRVRAVAAASSSRSKVGKRSPTKVTEIHDHRKNCSSGSASPSLRDEKLNGKEDEEGGGIGMNHIGSPPPQEGGCSSSKTAAVAGGGGGGEKVNGGGEVNGWPRVYIALTRKEKEEDFLAMKGTKLPHRPKKRPKTVDRMIQYCFPGMWLSDLTKSRYEVKEKKCSKKPKRRGGLKGMESIDSESE